MSNTSVARPRVVPGLSSGHPAGVIDPQSSHKFWIILAEARLTVWISEAADGNLVTPVEEDVIAMLKSGNLRALARDLVKHSFVDNSRENEDILLQDKIVGLRQ